MRGLFAGFTVAVTLACGLGVAACGSASKTAPPPAAAPTAPPPATTPPQATPPATPPAAAATPPAAAPAAGQPPAAAPAGAAPAAGAPAASGRGGRGAPPPPPPDPPKTMPKPVTPIVSATAPSPDPRVGLKAGWWDAGQAAWNMNLVSTTPPSGKSFGATHSDLAFSGKYTIQGQYNGFDIWDVSNAENPVLANQYNCPASQNDVSVFKNLLFMSSESGTSRADCGVRHPVTISSSSSKAR